MHKTDLLSPSPKRLLHIAPERELESKFKQVTALDYLTADLNNPEAMVKMDITNIQYPDNTFDAIFCSHVLEHVPEDRGAMRELHRVLRQDGFAVLMVPITVEETFEDPTITSPADRERAFGQHDHVRRYGPDFKDRLEESGFSASTIDAPDIMDESDRFRFGVLNPHDTVFLCKK